MRMKRVVLTGVTPLLMHKEDIAFAAKLKSWQNNPTNKKLIQKGDDRAPGWTWLGGVYHDGRSTGVPSDCLMAMLREAGAKVPVGKNNQSYKSISQSGIIVMEPLWPLTLADGKKLLWDSLKPLLDVVDYNKHKEIVQSLGFDLFEKRAGVSARSKHLRVRAIFAAGWKLEGTVTITDDIITDQVFSDILLMGGKYCGLLDWRPNASKPGPYGQFTAETFDI